MDISRSIIVFDKEHVASDVIKFLVIGFCFFAQAILMYRLDNDYRMGPGFTLSIVTITFVTYGCCYSVAMLVLTVLTIVYISYEPFFSLAINWKTHSISLFCYVINCVIAIIVIQLVKYKGRLEQFRYHMLECINIVNERLRYVDTYEKTVEIIYDVIYAKERWAFVYYPYDNDVGVDIEKPMYYSMKQEYIQIFQKETELTCVRWVATHYVKAGHYSLNQMGADCTYYPIMVDNECIGILGVYNTMTNKVFRKTMAYFYIMLNLMIQSMEYLHLQVQKQNLMIESECNKVKVDFLQSISHDFRTPLTTILGATNSLLNYSEQINKADKMKFLHNISDETLWLIRLVENILTITKVNNLKNINKNMECLEEIVAQAVTKVRNRFPSINIDVVVPGEVIMIPMDAVLMEQVIINLVENSIRHGGDISIVRIIVSRKDKEVVVSIQDDGCGLDEELLQVIFQEGYLVEKNVETKNKGYGLGLEICKTIIKIHNGNIFAKNNDERGAVFTFTLPMEVENG